MEVPQNRRIHARIMLGSSTAVCPQKRTKAHTPQLQYTETRVECLCSDVYIHAATPMTSAATNDGISVSLLSDRLQTEHGSYMQDVSSLLLLDTKGIEKQGALFVAKITRSEVSA